MAWNTENVLNFLDRTSFGVLTETQPPPRSGTDLESTALLSRSDGRPSTGDQLRPEKQQTPRQSNWTKARGDNGISSPSRDQGRPNPYAPTKPAPKQAPKKPDEERKGIWKYVPEFPSNNTLCFAFYYVVVGMIVILLVVGSLMLLYIVVKGIINVASSPDPSSFGTAPVPPSSLDCEDVASMASWTEERRAWCCQSYNIGCPNELSKMKKFDCSDGLGNWRGTFSDEKKVWCCATRQLSCPHSPPSPVSDPHLLPGLLASDQQKARKSLEAAGYAPASWEA